MPRLFLVIPAKAGIHRAAAKPLETNAPLCEGNAVDSWSRSCRRHRGSRPSPGRRN